MKKHGLAATMEARAHPDNRALFFACILVFVLVFYAVFLFWEEQVDGTVVTTHVANQAMTQVAQNKHAQLESEADQAYSSDDHRDTSSPVAEQQVAVNFLLHQLQASEQGITVVGVTQQGLSGYLGLHDGDQITEINGQVVQSVDEVQSLLHNYHPKQILHFKGKRDGQVMNWTYQAQADD